MGDGVGSGVGVAGASVEPDAPGEPAVVGRTDGAAVGAGEAVGAGVGVTASVGSTGGTVPFGAGVSSVSQTYLGPDATKLPCGPLPAKNRK